jgi:hypothetical protein
VLEPQACFARALVDFGPRLAPAPEIGFQHDFPPRNNRFGHMLMSLETWHACRQNCVSRVTLLKFFYA